MISKLHGRLGTAGLVVAIVALIAALAGTAFAASGLNSKQKKEVKSIAKSVAVPGPAGPQGTVGPVGLAGAKGDVGGQGKEGPQGKEGKQGKEGSPWTAGGVLPEEATETGTYLMTSETGTPEILGEYIGTAISFPVQLPIELEGEQVVFVPRGLGVEFPKGPAAKCEEGTAVAPAAAPGFLCVYEATSSHMKLTGEFFTSFKPTSGEGATVAGTLLLQVPTGANAEAEGTWAVTAGP